VRARRLQVQDAWLGRVSGGLLAGVREVVEVALAANGKSEILSVVLERFRVTLGVDVAAALLVGAAGVEPFVAEPGGGPLARPPPPARSAAARFARHAAPVLVDDLAGDIVGAFASTHVRSMVAVPLAGAGVLLYARAAPRAFDQDNLALVAQLGRRVGA